MEQESRALRIAIGLLALAAAVALCWYQVSVGLYSSIALGAAAAAAAYGAYALFGQGRVVRHPSVSVPDDGPTEGLDGDELARRIADEQLPYGVCARCRVIDRPPAFHGRCPRCDAGSDYVVVEADAERSLAASAAGVPARS